MAHSGRFADGPARAGDDCRRGSAGSPRPLLHKKGLHTWQKRDSLDWKPILTMPPRRRLRRRAKPLIPGLGWLLLFGLLLALLVGLPALLSSVSQTQRAPVERPPQP